MKSYAALILGYLSLGGQKGTELYRVHVIFYELYNILAILLLRLEVARLQILQILADMSLAVSLSPGIPVISWIVARPPTTVVISVDREISRPLLAIADSEGTSVLWKFDSSTRGGNVS